MNDFIKPHDIMTKQFYTKGTQIRRYIIFGIFLITFFPAFTQNSDWILQAKGISGQPLIPTVENHLTKDGEGNIFLSSNVVDSTQLDSFLIHGLEIAPGVPHLAAEYLAKINPQGEVMWIQTFTGAVGGIAKIEDMVANAAGDIFVVGKFINEIDFDTITVTSNFGDGDMFLAKFNKDGAIQWVETSDSQPGFSSSTGASIALGPTGDIIVSGFVKNNVNFQGVPIQVTGNAANFLASYDSNANLNWVRAYGASYPLSVRSEIAVDSNNEIYWVGNAASTASSNLATFDTISFNVEYGAMFIAKFNEDGDVIWLNAYQGDELSTFPIVASDLALDPNNNSVTIAGAFKDTVNFGNTTLTESSILGTDLFVVRFATNGDVMWAKQSHGVAEPVKVYDIDANDQGEVFVAMRVFNSMGLTPFTLGEGINAQTVTLDGATNGVVAKYKTDGELDWMKVMFGTGASEFHAVVATGSDQAVFSGFFTSTVVLDDTSLVATPGSNSSNVFVASCNGESATSIFKPGVLEIGVKVYPNPAKDQVYIELEENQKINQITISNLQGQLLRTVSNPSLKEKISLDRFSVGLYLIGIHTKEGVLNRKLVLTN